MDYLAEYEKSLEMKGLKDGTIYRYLRISEQYLKTNPDFSKESIQTFINDLSGRGTYRRWAFTVLHNFFDRIEKPWPFSRNEAPKHNQPNQPFLTEEEAKAFMTKAAESPLHHAVFRLIIATGARRIDITNIEMKHLNPPRISIPGSKGEDLRTIQVDVGTQTAIQRWIEVRPKPQAEYMFTTKTGHQFSPDQIGELFRDIADELDMEKGVGPHALRRSVATMLHNNGLSLKEIQDFMGWKSPQMPLRYIQLDDTKNNAKAIAANPILSE